MKKEYEERRKQLLSLIQSLGRGGIARVAATIGVEPNYLSRMLYPEGKSGKKNIGDEMITKLSAAYPQWIGRKTPDRTTTYPRAAEPESTTYGPNASELTAEESKMLAAFRHLPPEQRAAFSMLIRKEADLHQALTRLSDAAPNLGARPAKN